MLEYICSSYKALFVGVIFHLLCFRWTDDIPLIGRIPLNTSPVSTVLQTKVTSPSCVMSLRSDRKQPKEGIQGASNTYILSHLMLYCLSYMLVKML